METYSRLFLMSCLGCLFALFYTMYMLFLDVRYESKSWYQIFVGGVNEKKSVTNYILFTSLLCMATALVGMWLFWYNRQYAKKNSAKCRSLGGILASVTITLMAILILPTDILLVSMLAISTLAAVHYYMSNGISLRQLFSKMFVALLIISYPWEFMRLYKHQLAVQHHHMINNVPAECLPPDPTLLNTLGMWVRETFTWGKNEDKCLQYHKAMLVEPIWEVTPVKVLMSLVTRCFTHPLEIISSSIGVCYSNLFKHLPLQWQPVVMIQVIFLSVVLLIMGCRYSIKNLWILHIEPANMENIEPVLKYKTPTTRPHSAIARNKMD